MELNLEKLRELLTQITEKQPPHKRVHAVGYRAAEEALGIKASQLHRVLNGKMGAGRVFLTRLRTYCQKNGLKFEDFII